jgi:23S rRNA G2069 N7-methylase RlmK/C1962 C5-methylase RlmI
LGGGGIMRRKRPAKRNIGVDIDPKVMTIWSAIKKPAVEIYQEDAVKFLKSYHFTGKEFVYCDPPYLRGKRERTRKLYTYEYTREQHIELLEIIRKIPAMVMISGYESTLYKTSLHDWRSFSFKAKTHKNTAIEWIWMNYPAPTALHDYRYLGNNSKEREKIKNTVKSWKSRIQKMSVLERQALLSMLRSFIED